MTPEERSVVALETIASTLVELRAINAKVAEAVAANAEVNKILAEQMTGLRATIQGAQRVIREKVVGQIERGREHDRVAAETAQLLRDARPEEPTDG